MTQTRIDHTIEITTFDGCIEIAIINGENSTTLDPAAMRELANLLNAIASTMEDDM